MPMLLRRCAATAAAMLGGGTLLGCSLLFSPARPPAAWPPDLPPRVDLTAVPFFAQDEYQCGPAALAIALGAAGVERSPAQLVDQVYLPERRGTLQPEMLAAARRAGLLAYPLAPDEASVLREVAAGHPVVILQNLRWDVYPQWHYAVVVGYDLTRDQRYLRSGVERRRVMAGEEFERSWARAGRWAFVALPPERLPATATEADFVTAAAALERASTEAARRAYLAALVRWPDDLVARIGLGNVAYAGHRLDEAQAQYQLAVEQHPGSADGWNNLAQTLHELGRDAEARRAARRAVALGGARLDEYRATLRAIPDGERP